MGEAKRKQAALMELAKKQFARWDFPVTAEEAAAVAEIEQLDSYIVHRYPKHMLDYMKMKPNECHANARFMEANDPEQKTKHVTGYWPQAGNYVLHSVVLREGEMLCVTPLAINAPDSFTFIPDFDIEWKQESDGYTAYRKGYKVEPGLRSDPLENKRIADIIIARMEAGVPPLKAGEPPF
ncbi:hypothetical protein QP179_03285 [Sphingomonas aurantiaca]|uniref:hypothetical protein n=1 Tax=Sphingomonas aurantiaca TaxID=185949 RepID=UPI002FE14698